MITETLTALARTIKKYVFLPLQMKNIHSIYQLKDVVIITGSVNSFQFLSSSGKKTRFPSRTEELQCCINSPELVSDNTSGRNLKAIFSSYYVFFFTIYTKPSILFNWTICKMLVDNFNCICINFAFLRFNQCCRFTLTRQIYPHWEGRKKGELWT